jgi:hypothetical protein
MAYGSYAYGQHNYKGVLEDTDPSLTTSDYFIERPNWIYGVSILFGMRTAINTTRKLIESRRPLRRDFYRVERFTVSLKDGSQKFEHFVESKHAGIFYLPIFTEPIHPSGTGSMDTLEHFEVEETLPQLFNLRWLTNYVMLIDRKEQVTTQVAPYSKYETISSGYSIVLASSISGSFQKESTIVYPCMIAYLSNVKIVDRTDDTIEMEMTYREKL